MTQSKFEDEETIKWLDSIVEERARDFTDQEYSRLESLSSLLKWYNVQLVDQEERREKDLKTICATRDDILEIENIVGDIDVSTGFACLRCEEGDKPTDTLVFLKMDLLGQVQQQKDDEFLPTAMHGSLGIIKRLSDERNSRIQALADIVRENADFIAQELDKPR